MRNWTVSSDGYYPGIENCGRRIWGTKVVVNRDPTGTDTYVTGDGGPSETIIEVLCPSGAGLDESTVPSVTRE